MHHFTHRFGDYAMRPEGSLDSELPRIPAEKLQDPNYSVLPRYWVAEWEVIKATSDVPRELIQAVDKQSEDLARQAISAWLAGYILEVGQEALGNPLLVRRIINAWDLMEAAIQKRFVALALHAEYLLDKSDFNDVPVDGSYLALGDHVIRKRVPTWLLAFRDITNATNERTAILTVLPLSGMGNKLPIIKLGLDSVEKATALMANWGSCVFDYATRQKLAGTTMNFFYVKQLPILAPRAYSKDELEFIKRRVVELTYCSWDLERFAHSEQVGAAPFYWDEARRFLLRSELDAQYFHLYGIGRDDVVYIMDTFPITRRKEEQQYNEYRTRRVILDIYDAMAKVQTSGVPYQTVLDPPPADSRVAHVVIPPLAAMVLPQMPPVELSVVVAGAWVTPAGLTPDNP